MIPIKWLWSQYPILVQQKRFFIITSRSIRLQMFFKKGIYRKKPVLVSLFQYFFIKKISIFFIKNRLQHRCFSMNIAKFLRASFLQNTSGDYFGTSDLIFKSNCIYWQVLSNQMIHLGLLFRSRSYVILNF